MVILTKNCSKKLYTLDTFNNHTYFETFPPLKNELKKWVSKSKYISKIKIKNTVLSTEFEQNNVSKLTLNKLINFTAETS